MRAARAAAVVFRFLEIRKNAVPIPARISELRPMIVIGALPANGNEPVDRTRSAEAAPARPINFSAVHVRLGVGVETPVINFMKHRLSISDRNMDPEIVVARSRLEQQNLVAAV